MAEHHPGPVVAPVDGRNAARIAERHFTDGSLLGMRERHAEAITEYRRALRYDTTRGAVYYAIGRSFRELNEIDSAIHYTRLASMRGRTPTVHEQLADLLMVSGDVDGAIAQYDSMLTLDPNHLQSRYMLARLLQRREPSRAIVHYEYILRNIVDDIDVMLRLAELYLDARNVDAAIGMMKRMIALEPTSPEIHQMTTTILLDAGRYQEALDLLRAAESSVPNGRTLETFYVETLREVDDRLSERDRDDSLIAYAHELVVRAGAAAPSSTVRLHGGTVALRIGDSAGAEALFSRAIADSTASAQMWTHVASMYLETGDAATGLRVVLPETARFGDDYRVPYLTGLLYIAVSDDDSAVAWLRRSVDLYDDNADAWGALGRLYQEMDRVGASDAAYEKSIDIDPENPVVLNNFAYALAHRGSRLDRALELIEMALEFEPENESFLDTRGWVHFKRGELDEALRFIERAVAAGGASVDVYEHLGDVRSARGERDEAREAYRRALRLDGTREDIVRKIESIP